MNKINHMRASVLFKEFGTSYDLLGVAHCDFLNDISDVIQRFMKHIPSVLTISSCKDQNCSKISAQSTPSIHVDASAFQNCIANLEAAVAEQCGDADSDSSGICPRCQGDTATKKSFRHHIVIRVKYFYICLKYFVSCDRSKNFKPR